jgi:hypothetical protein
MSYEERLGFPCDFKVEYRFYEENEGGPAAPPRQGYRSDFAFADDDIRLTGLYMIWPEFENDAGDLFPEDHGVPKSGTARMWVVSDEARRVVRRKVRHGARGFFMEDGRRVAEVVVTRIVGLHTNPPAPAPGDTPDQSSGLQ